MRRSVQYTISRVCGKEVTSKYAHLVPVFLLSLLAVVVYWVTRGKTCRLLPGCVCLLFLFCFSGVSDMFVYRGLCSSGSMLRSRLDLGGCRSHC